jgi:hypothetical protein
MYILVILIILKIDIQINLRIQAVFLDQLAKSAFINIIQFNEMHRCKWFFQK